MTEITYRSKPSGTQLMRKLSSFRSFVVRLFRENPLGAIGAVVCLIFLFAAIFADLIGRMVRLKVTVTIAGDNLRAPPATLKAT